MRVGTAPWIVRALRDWAEEVVQGTAMVVYYSSAARNQLVHELTDIFEEQHLRVRTIHAGLLKPEDFVRQVAHMEYDVLFVLDPDILLFSGQQPLAKFWVNFNREAIVGHPGVQIWFFPGQSSILFARDLPDLNRFFLFREELKEDDDGTDE
jgi:hypothetical protein